MTTERDVGFIGLGLMGCPMAGHILSAGFRLHVYNRSRNKAVALLDKGAIWHDSPGAVAAHSRVTITMVGYPSDVEALYFGPGGLIESARPGTYLVDMTTSDAGLAERIHAAAKAKELHGLDAPVSGGESGAREARLSLMVGGEDADLEAVRPVLKPMCRDITLCGPAGSGQRTKMCNQIAIAGTFIGICEALAYAEHFGLDTEKVMASLASGTANSSLLGRLGPRMLARDFTPGFHVHHFIKDLAVGLTEARSAGLDLPGIAVVKALFDRLARDGGRDLDIRALFGLYRPALPAKGWN